MKYERKSLKEGDLLSFDVMEGSKVFHLSQGIPGRDDPKIEEKVSNDHGRVWIPFVMLMTYGETAKDAQAKLSKKVDELAHRLAVEAADEYGTEPRVQDWVRLEEILPADGDEFSAVGVRIFGMLAGR